MLIMQCYFEDELRIWDSFLFLYITSREKKKRELLKTEKDPVLSWNFQLPTEIKFNRRFLFTESLLQLHDLICVFAAYLGKMNESLCEYLYVKSVKMMEANKNTRSANS